MPPPTVIQEPFATILINGVYTADATGKIPIANGYIVIYRQISVMVKTKAATSVALTMGLYMCVGGVAPFGLVGEFQNDDGLVHTYPVSGPTFQLFATGAAAYAQIPLEGYVFVN